MKIRNLTDKGAPVFGLGERDGRPADVQPRAFLDELRRVQGSNIKQRLDKILQELEQQGRRLSQSMTIGDLKQYKQLVKNFLAEALGKTYHIKEEAHWDHKGRHKVFTTVEKVDEKMEELTSMVLEQQQDQLAVLAKMDEIRGLLIDLYS
ncbi:MAG: YaaR family protein [Thermincolia bacterium]